MPRMIALAVVIVVGVYYIVFDVMQYRIASPPMAVTVLMPGAGGLYSGADVTYRELDDLSHCYPREINPVILNWLNGAS